MKSAQMTKQGTKIVRYMAKLKKQGTEQFLWGSLALQMGYTKLGLPDIARTKEEFSHITNLEQLEDLWISFGESIGQQFKKVYGKDLRFEK